MSALASRRELTDDEWETWNWLCTRLPNLPHSCREMVMDAMRDGWIITDDGDWRTILRRHLGVSLSGDTMHEEVTVWHTNGRFTGSTLTVCSTPKKDQKLSTLAAFLQVNT